jgi:hypothetical protein
MDLFWSHVHLHGGPAPVRRFLPELIDLFWSRKINPGKVFDKGQVYPGNNFEYHLIPFEAALAAETAAIMPYYGIPVDQTEENVAMSFNKTIITGLLRGRYHFDGVIVGCDLWQSQSRR